MPISIRAKSRNNRQAFSLIEWLVVLMIIGMTLAIVIPKVGGVPSGIQVASSVDAIRSAFTTAVSASMASGQPVQLFFDFSGHEIRLSRLGESRLETAGLEGPQWTILDEFTTFRLAESVWLNDQLMDYPDDPESQLSFRFYPNGEATGPSLPILIGERWFQIDVDRLTAKPLIREQDAY